MKWKKMVRFIVSFIDMNDRDSEATTSRRAESMEDLRAKLREDADWMQVKTIQDTRDARWYAATNPELPAIGDRLLLHSLTLDCKMVEFTHERGNFAAEAWVRTASRSYNDWRGKTCIDTEVTIAVPAEMFDGADLAHGWAEDVIDNLWAKTVTDWRKDYIANRKINSRVIGDAFVVTINWHMNLS